MKVNFNKLVSIVLIIVMAASMMIGCSQDEGNAGTREDLNIAVSSIITSLDPTSVSDRQQGILYNSIYDTLVKLDSEGQPISSIAKSWTYNEDEMSWTFELNEGIKFSNGEDLTAEDVKYTFDRFYQTPMGMYYSLNIGVVEQLDEYTVKITMPAVFEGIFSALSSYVYILPKDYLEEVGGDISIETVGSGAYIVKEFTPGAEVSLVKNESYHGEEAKIPNVKIQFVSDASTRIISLESGQVDFIMDPSFDDRQNLMNNEDLKFEEIPSFSRYTGAITQFGATADPKLREAIKYAIDTEEIMMAMVDGVGIINEGPLPETVYVDYKGLVDMSEYNVDKAKVALAESDFDVNADKVNITVLDPGTQRVAEIMQGQLGEIGIQVNVELIEVSSYYQRIAEKTIEMSISVGGGLDFGPQEDIGGFTSSQDTADRWPNSDIVDNAHEELIKTSDLEERKALVKEAYEAINEMNIVIPMFTPYSMVTYNKDLKGVLVHPLSFYSISEFSW